MIRFGGKASFLTRETLQCHKRTSKCITQRNNRALTNKVLILSKISWQIIVQLSYFGFNRNLLQSFAKVQQSLIRLVAGLRNAYYLHTTFSTQTISSKYHVKKKKGKNKLQGAEMLSWLK